MNESEDELLVTAEDHVGDALRSVASYREKDHELQYLRDDIAEAYTEAEIVEVFHELALSGIGREYLEKIFHAGRIECMIYCFEDAVMFHFVTDGFTGRFVTVDRQADIDMDEFVTACKAAL